MFSGRTTTTFSAPAHGPLDYNALRPSFGQLAPLFGLTLLALLPIALGGLLIYWSWPSEQEVGGLRVLGLALGALLALAGVRFFWPLSTTIPDAIQQWYAMVYAWHGAELTKYEQGDGQVVAHQVSEWTYSDADIRSILLTIGWLIVEQPKNLSIEKMTRGPLMVSVGHRAYKVLDMTQDGAASWLNMLDRAGIMQGRAPRKAGTVVAMDSRQLALKLLTEAAKNPTMIAQDSAP